MFFFFLVFSSSCPSWAASRGSFPQQRCSFLPALTGNAFAEKLVQDKNKPRPLNTRQHTFLRGP